MIRVLIIAPQWIGDAVMTEPLLRHLSERGEQIIVFAVPWVAPIYRAMQHITGLQTTVDVPFQHGGLQWQARRALAARIKSDEWGKFDRAYVLPNSLKSALLPWLANIPERVGYHGEMRYGLLNERLPNPPRDARGAMVAHYLALAGLASQSASQLGSGDSVANNWGLTPTAINVPRLTNGVSKGSDPNWLADLKPQTYTVIAPGAEYGPAKRWPAEHFAALIAKLDHPVVLLGSAKESDLCEAIRDMALRVFRASPAQTIHNLAGKTSLQDAIHIIANSKNMVSNDSGLMHVAAAFVIPQVAIFGSSDPRHTPPLSDKAKVLWLKEMEGEFKGLPCSPCFKRECPLKGDVNLRCLKAIEPALINQVLGNPTLNLSRFISQACLGHHDISIKVGVIESSEAMQIKALLGKEVATFPRVLEAHAIRHIMKSHGNKARETKRGQLPIDLLDFERVNSLAQKGLVKLGDKLHRGSPTITTIVSDVACEYHLVQAIRSKDISLVTMRKR